MRNTLKRIALLFVLGAAVGLGINAARGSRGVNLGKKIQATADRSAGSCVAPGAAEGSIPVAEAAALRGTPGVAFADIRPPEEYARGHVAGAWHLPCWGSASVAASSMAKLSGTRTLVLYGRDDPQADAHVAAQELRRRGFADVRIVQGGFAVWQAAGLPAESGPCDECRK